MTDSVDAFAPSQNIEDLAVKVVYRLTPKSDIETMGLDPGSILAIISILAKLIPMIQECSKKDENPEDAAVRLASSRTYGWRFRELRLRRLVRNEEYFADADTELISDISQEVYRLGTSHDNARILFQEQ